MSVYEEMTYAETRYNPGGLFRCCLESICDYVVSKSDEEAPSMERILTRCCNEPVELGPDGVWKWSP